MDLSLAFPNALLGGKSFNGDCGVLLLESSLWSLSLCVIGGGSGGDGLLRPTESDLSRFDDRVLDKNDDDDGFVGLLLLLVVNLRPFIY